MNISFADWRQVWWHCCPQKGESNNASRIHLQEACTFKEQIYTSRQGWAVGEDLGATYDWDGKGAGWVMSKFNINELIVSKINS